ncbi:MAG: phospho-N-acetylmuramoyl-pentapeptide-transferase [Lachnospiraceae bacterium]|nr:phospho-N-acetylmuramoyl-pentapeptide-transferase [Lachnospiraceae bacterium]
MVATLLNNAGVSESIIALLRAAVAFLGTFFFLKWMMPYLPSDQGREYAVDGALSKGKARGAGIVFVLVFVVTVLLFTPMKLEHIIYLILVVLAMLTGFLDDAAKTPWGEYKKGFLDLVIAVLIAVTFIHYNSTEVTLALFGVSFVIPKILFGILVVILVWAAINVTNCSDGVDGLSATLTIITLSSAYLLIHDPFGKLVPAFILCLFAYLWYNANPSSLLMGDAGSRAMGLFIAITMLKTQSPFLYLLLGLITILDGGLGLIKVSLKRFLKISILTHTTCPLHDHVRKNKGWSNNQVVFRFAILQIVICIAALLLVRA